MKVLFIEYPTCSTCKKAKKTLKDMGLEVESRNIVNEVPTYDELKKWWALSGLELKKFFNTSGNIYKELHMKDKIKTMSEDEQLNVLSTNGMLIKRPIVVVNEQVIVGFHEDKYKNICSE